jgi:hypothetical protein
VKLTYWLSQTLDDSDCYSIRERTKKECLARRNEAVGKPDAKASEYVKSDSYCGPAFGPVYKVTVEYDSGFDLMAQCLSEGRLGYEEETSKPFEDNHDPF